jgi:hypothetical protein
MKVLFLFIIISLSLSAHAQQSYKVVGWHIELNTTCVLIELEWGKEIAFYVEGIHYNDLEYMLHHGYVLTRKSAYGAFPLTDIQYTSKKDKSKIKSSLNIKQLRNYED